MVQPPPQTITRKEPDNDEEVNDKELPLPEEPKPDKNDLYQTFINRKKYLLECSKVIYHNRMIKEKKQ